jgi:hypothetical protein
MLSRAGIAGFIALHAAGIVAQAATAATPAWKPEKAVEHLDARYEEYRKVLVETGLAK